MMTLQEALNYFKNLEAETKKKSEIKVYQNFIQLFINLEKRDLSDFEDYYQKVCFQIWKSRNNFRGQSEWSTWV
jgi:RNA polymerase sigma-70 factor (ECF subfamily)